MTSESPKSEFTLKEDKKHLVTGPVAIPNCPDCDFNSGEKILTIDEIENMVHEYNTSSRKADEMHVFGRTGETIGDAVENWTLKEPMTVKNINNKTITLPKGTWMATVKVTDPTTWERIEKGEYRGFSAMYVSRQDAETVLASKRTLIADLEDPVPLTISIVDAPCVYDAIFTSIKEVEETKKAGRRFSDATLDKIMNLFNTLKGGFNEVESLIKDAEAERAPKKHQDTEDYNMNEDEVKKMIEESLEPLRTENEALKSEIEALKETPEPEPEPEPEVDPEPTPVEKELQETQKRLETLEKRLGNPTPQNIKGSDKVESQTPPVVKGDFEDRDAFGRKIK